ncbi:hypothetical protein Vadar_033137 [Vaccinium darrowii]|uniref:Uncharacterized protein n=1 Tax=Vaccinium darrowii TaxID=229202 RepID=A0ACB7X6L3_9ERIC|nr:hypothetical protein Vadar_033137 [Vaccinium darrowii]
MFCFTWRSVVAGLQMSVMDGYLVDQFLNEDAKLFHSVWTNLVGAAIAIHCGFGRVIEVFRVVRIEVFTWKFERTRGPSKWSKKEMCRREHSLHNLRNLQWTEWNGYLRPRAELISIKDFQKMKPPVFGGGIDPSRADDWELGMEKIFAVMTSAQCPETHKTIRDSRANEFSNLKQPDSMSMAGYDKKFTELSRYASHLVATDALRAQRLVDGLNDKYRLQVKLSGKRTYTDVLNVALMVEEEQAKMRGSDGGQQTKRINYVPPKDQRGASSFKKRNTKYIGVESGWSQGGSSSSGSGSQLCPKCGRMHRGQCYRDMGACFKCGAVGHVMKNCPTWAKQSVATPAATISSGQSTGTKPDAGKKQARAFALIPGDPENANSVVSEKLRVPPGKTLSSQCGIYTEGRFSHNISRCLVSFKRVLDHPPAPENVKEIDMVSL